MCYPECSNSDTQVGTIKCVDNVTAVDINYWFKYPFIPNSAAEFAHLVNTSLVLIVSFVSMKAAGSLFWVAYIHVLLTHSHNPNVNHL